MPTMPQNHSPTLWLSRPWGAPTGEAVGAGHTREYHCGYRARGALQQKKP